MAGFGYIDPMMTRAPVRPPAAMNTHTHLTDSMSPGPIQGAGRAGGGYGSYWNPPNPDTLTGIVNSQPGVMSANNLFQSGSVAAELAKQQQIQNLVIGYGDPSIAQSLGASVDPATAALAQSNTISGLSDLGKTQVGAAQARQNFLASLAAHGLGHSGLLGQGLDQQSQALAQQRGGLLDALRTGISGATTTATNTVNGLATNAQNAYIQGQANVQSHPTQFNLPQPQFTTVGPPLPKLPAAPHFSPASPGPSLPTFGSHGQAPLGP